MGLIPGTYKPVIMIFQNLSFICHSKKKKKKNSTPRLLWLNLYYDLVVCYAFFFLKSTISVHHTSINIRCKINSYNIITSLQGTHTTIIHLDTKSGAESNCIAKNNNQTGFIIYSHKKKSLFIMISRILSIKSSQTLPFKIMNGFVEFFFIFFIFLFFCLFWFCF